jgi:spermine oxidase
VSPEIVKEVAREVKSILETCEAFAEDGAKDYPTSVGFFLRQNFNNYVDKTASCDEDRQIKELLLDWHLRFQVIDNSCRILEELSAKSWGDFENYPGKDCSNLTDGYSSLVDAMVSELPKDCIRLSAPAAAIVYQTTLSANNVCANVSGQNKECWVPPVVVTCENGEQFGAQFVIVTCSLGVLKANYKNFFLPALPAYLSQVS